MAVNLRQARDHKIRPDRMLSAVVVALVVVMVGACGKAVGPTSSGATSSLVETTAANTTGTTTPAPPPPGGMSETLRAWANFPVRADPRPLVLIDDPVKATEAGFPTNDAKEAFAEGAFTVAPDLPPPPPDANGYPIIDARAALTVMRSEGTPLGGGPAPVIAPLAITRVELDSAPFQTDRGTRPFPVWLFSFEGVTNPAKVLAVAPQSFFPEPLEVSHNLGGPGAELAPDGRTLTVTFVGAAEGAGPCTADYAVDQATSASAVAIRVREVRRGNGQAFVCTQEGHTRHASIVLDAPLGNRVLVSGDTRGAIPTAP